MSTVHRHNRTLWTTTALVLAASAIGYGASARAEGPGEGKKGDALPKCIVVTPQALPRGYGYDHIVEITNGCDKPAVCSVKTNVITDPIERSVSVGQTERVLTLRGSPSGAFSPDVTCKLGSS